MILFTCYVTYTTVPLLRARRYGYVVVDTLWRSVYPHYAAHCLMRHHAYALYFAALRLRRRAILRH